MGPFKKVFDYVRKSEGDISDNFRDLYYLFLCQASYLKPETLDILAHQIPKLQDYTVFFSDLTTSVVYVIGDTAIVSVRGNTNKTEVVRSFSFIPTEFNGMTVHSGFARTADELCYSGIDTKIARLVKQGKKIVYTGHSSGGAVVTLLSSFETPESIVTFGSPRVITLKSEATRFAGVKYTRYFTKHDCVRFLPPSLLYTYKHVGETICLPSKLSFTDPLKSHRISTYASSYMEYKNDSLYMQ